MPFSPVATLGPEHLKIAAQTFCDVFRIESLHLYQEEAGQNILRGVSTFLDVPTRGGKTIAFWNALFYHWQPGSTSTECQKIILVVGPLVELLEAQSKTLNGKQIPAAAITSKSENIEQLLTVSTRCIFNTMRALSCVGIQNLGNHNYRVSLVGPEIPLSS